MPYGLYLSAEGAAAQSRRMEVLANNLANVDTVGFKRQLAVVQARAAEAIRQGLSATGDGTINDVGGGVEVPETLTDFSNGTLKQTGVPTDLAIEGEGFFVVQGDSEERLLTRAGDFRLTPEGQLVTQDGEAVLSSDYSPVQLNPFLPFNVSDNGTVFQAGEALPLAMVKPKFNADLVQQGVNTFRSLSDIDPLEAGDRQVRQGFLELSGVVPTTEMMEMIEASRAFESNVRLIQHQDQAIGNLLSRVLRS
jgi:flagellar basal-body rod protein FlgF/flagellar basal-body rod protein FlgG